MVAGHRPAPWEMTQTRKGISNVRNVAHSLVKLDAAKVARGLSDCTGHWSGKKIKSKMRKGPKGAGTSSTRWLDPPQRLRLCRKEKCKRFINCLLEKCDRVNLDMIADIACYAAGYGNSLDTCSSPKVKASMRVCTDCCDRRYCRGMSSAVLIWCQYPVQLMIVPAVVAGGVAVLPIPR